MNCGLPTFATIHGGPSEIIVVRVQAFSDLMMQHVGCRGACLVSVCMAVGICCNVEGVLMMHIAQDGKSGFHIDPYHGEDAADKMAAFFERCQEEKDYWDTMSQGEADHDSILG